MPSSAATRNVLRAFGSLLLLTGGLVAAAGLETEEARPSSSRCFVVGCHTTSTRHPLRLPEPLPRRRVAVPILMYHRINVPSPGAPAITRRLTVHPADFARQMRWLRRHGYQTVTQRQLFGALMHGWPLGERPIMITFDDGYRDVFYKAAPVLTKLRMQGTAYVISDRVVNGDRTFLSPGLLRALEREGIEIGSHSVSHADLTQLSDREVLAELKGSRRSLERWLRHPVQWLAYPFGAYDGRVERLARRAGYVLAVTTEEGTLHSADRPLALQRLRVLDSTGVRGLAELLGNAFLR
jgi:peptidoglycan/xylan/chitin deacetylase (PgdA/CDA1 family)